MKKRKDKLVSVYLMFGLILLVIGFSYAFFIYNKTGLYTHTITGGKMKVIYDETTGNNITIENAYPLTDKEAETKSLEFEFTITGYNESDKNVYYAIEIDHGEDVSGKNRFLDSDMKLTLYENNELIFENEIFNNLDNQDIYYNYFKAGTNSETPTINNYKMRIWINDNVIISDTLSNDVTTWSDADIEWLYESHPEKFYEIGDGDSQYLEDYGISVYTSDEFANSYANFKVNVRANLTGQDIGMLFYDANGGEYTPKPTSLATNRVTMQKPVMENKGFLGWSTTSDGDVEYKSGEYYTGKGQVLYAVYSDVRNVMGFFHDDILDTREIISKVNFINDTQENIDERYNVAYENILAVDLTLDEQGSVKAWLEEDYIQEWSGKQLYTLYIGSEGATYIEDCSGLFAAFETVESINFDNVDTSMATNMSGMFSDCNGIRNLDLSAFNTSNVTNMSYMFAGGGTWYGNYIEHINLENFDTSNVTDMSRMFYYCVFGLSELDLSSFDTSNVETMELMFAGCARLTELDLSNFDMSNIINASKLFFEDGAGVTMNLRTLKFGDVYMPKAENLSYMFADCENLTEIVVEKFIVDSVCNMEGMFYECNNIMNLSFENWYLEPSNVDYMFSGCISLIKIDLSNINTNNITNINAMFQYCRSLSSASVSCLFTDNLKSISSLFEECSSLTNIDTSNWDTSNLTTMGSIFSGCSSLTTIDVSKWDMHNITNLGVFYGCDGLVSIDLSSWDTSNVTSIANLFCNCSNLTYVNFSGWNTSKLESMSGIFQNCISLTDIDLSSINTSKVTSMSYMFSGCSNLVNVDLSNFDTSKVTDMQCMFSRCSNLRSLDLSNFDTSNLKRMCASHGGNYYERNTGMFYNCTNLTYLDISSFNFSALEYYYYAFLGMSVNAKIYVGSEANQTKILNIGSSYRPAWTTENVIVKS